MIDAHALQATQLEFVKTALKGLKIDPHSMLDQSLIGSSQVAQVPAFVEILQDPNIR